jgi:alpha,alpha-trehalase
MLPIVGFLPGADRRVRSTIDAIDAGLTDGRGLVYRYRSHDGLEGEKGTFLICTFWLSQALAEAGERDRARRSKRSPTSTTWACSPRRWTHRVGSSWATIR